MTGSVPKGLDEALARAGDGVFAIGGDGHIVFWNRAAERILGWTARAALGRACCDVFQGWDSDGNRLCYQGCHVQTLVARDEPVQSFDMQTRTQAGRAIWINVSVLRLNSQGSPPLVVHLFRDVTAAKELLTMVHERLAAPPPSGEAGGMLTRRELEVLRLMGTGASTAAAADALHVSRATIRNHVQNILGKLGVHSRLEAVAYATRHRLV